MFSWINKLKKKVKEPPTKVLICIYTYPGSEAFNYYKKEELFYKKIPDNYDVVLVYGHDGETVLENNHLKMNHEETYKGLPVKTFKMFKILSQYGDKYKGFIKYDDDNKLFNPSIFDDVAKKDYSGFRRRHNPAYYKVWCRHKRIIEYCRPINTDFYFGGPIYYVSNKFAALIAKEDESIAHDIWAEDVLMGELFTRHKDELEAHYCNSTMKIMIENELGNYNYLGSNWKK